MILNSRQSRHLNFQLSIFNFQLALIKYPIFVARGPGGRCWSGRGTGRWRWHRRHRRAWAWRKGGVIGDTPALHANNFHFDEEILVKGADFFEELAEKFQ